MNKSPEKLPSLSATNAAIKETVESIIIAFVLAFVFRAYVVEAFVIPTGSMAPTLLGKHLTMRCSKCGYHYTTDTPDSQADVTICPMCNFRNLVPRNMRTSAGDRILVLKYLYAFSEPRRWDVVVFKAPHEPKTNFIKRLVGKPSESLLIIEGNVYVKPDQPADSDWEIARKTCRENVQRAVFQPIYHSQFIPLDQGQRERPWQVPWVAIEGQWQIENRHSYQHETVQRGVIAFDFSRTKPHWARWYPYNQIKKRHRHMKDEVIEDIRLSATFEPKMPGLAIRMRTSARWNGSWHRLPLAVRITSDGTTSLESKDSDQEQWAVIKSERVEPLTPGRSRNVEMWFVDQKLSLWIDGQCELYEEFDIPMAQLKSRPKLQSNDYPQIAIEVEGAPVELHRIELDRDMYYSSTPPGINAPGRGTLAKYGLNASGQVEFRQGDVVRLGHDDFFCLGDNSPMSHDSRYWESVDPWVERRLFFNHGNGHKENVGIVPRELMLGRAFFVYFPAPHRWRIDQLAVFPNFGDMRVIY